MLLMFFFNRGICIFLLGLWLCVDCVQYIYSTKYLGFLLLVDSFAVTNWHWYQLVAFKETTNKIFTVLLYTVMVYVQTICLWSCKILLFGCIYMSYKFCVINLSTKIYLINYKRVRWFNQHSMQIWLGITALRCPRLVLPL